MIHIKLTIHNFIRLLRKPCKTLQDLTKLHAPLHNFTSVLQDFTKLNKINIHNFHNTSQNFATSFKFYNAFHNSTQLYQTLHNFTKLYNTSQHFTQLYKILYKTLQDFTKLYNILHNFLFYKIWQICTQVFKTKKLNKTLQTFTKPYRLDNTLQDCTNLHNTLHSCIQLSNNCIQLQRNFTHIYTIVPKSAKLFNTLLRLYKHYTTLYKLQNCTQLFTNFTITLHNYTKQHIYKSLHNLLIFRNIQDFTTLFTI